MRYRQPKTIHTYPNFDAADGLVTGGETLSLEDESYWTTSRETDGCWYCENHCCRQLVRTFENGNQQVIHHRMASA